MEKEITTHEQLLKLHGKKITCDIDGAHIYDARINVEENNNGVYVCQNIKDGAYCKEKFGYKYSWCISVNFDFYENYNRDCTNIKLAEEEQADLDQSMDYMTPKQVITPPNHYKLEINNQVVDVNMILEAVAKKLDKCDLMTWAYFTNSIEYLLRSWFKGQ